MRKLQEAPGQLERVRRFVNTVDVERGNEELSSPEALTAWLREHGFARDDVQAGPEDLERALALREALRAMLLANNGWDAVAPEIGRSLDRAALRARVQLRFAATGRAVLQPAASGVDAAFGRLLSIVHRSMVDGSWPRLKACREHTCAWAFYDHTRNRSGTWCNMAVCGNRAKARAYRQRHAGT